MSITKRLAQLEARQVNVSTTPKRLIATALEVPSDPTLNGTHSVSGNVVTFYASTMLDAYKLRCTWLDAQSGLIAMVSPLDSGRCVEKVLAERHADE